MNGASLKIWGQLCGHLYIFLIHMLLGVMTVSCYLLLGRFMFTQSEIRRLACALTKTYFEH